MVGILMAQEMLDLELKAEAAEQEAKRTGLLEGWNYFVSELGRADAIRRSFGLPDLNEIRVSTKNETWERCPSCGFMPMRGRDGFHSCKQRLTAMLTIAPLGRLTDLPAPPQACA